MLRPPERPTSDPGSDLADWLAERDRQDAETYRLIQQHQDAELAVWLDWQSRQDAEQETTYRLLVELWTAESAALDQQLRDAGWS